MLLYDSFMCLRHAIYLTYHKCIASSATSKRTEKTETWSASCNSCTYVTASQADKRLMLGEEITKLYLCLAHPTEFK